jgi:hypothetical protein
MQTVKNQFKVPEGRYVLHSEKSTGLVPFAMRRTTRLTVATLHGGDEEGMYMIYNVGDYLHVAPFNSTEKVGCTLASDALPSVLAIQLKQTLLRLTQPSVVLNRSSSALDCASTCDISACESFLA